MRCFVLVLFPYLGVNTGFINTNRYLNMYVDILFLILLSYSIYVRSWTKLSVLHVNDIHSHFEEVNINTGTCKEQHQESGEGCYGGIARIASYVKSVRAEDPQTLFLNAGDFYQGTMWYSVFKYQPVVEFSNLVNTSAGSLGNHDWDDSDAGLQPFIDKATFPLLAANLDTDSVRGVRKSIVLRFY